CEQKMGGFSAMQSVQMPTRSISLPSRLNPNSDKAEAELNKLRTWEYSCVISTTNPLGAEAIQTGLLRLAELFNCIEELIHSPCAQKSLHQQQHLNLVEEALDGSVVFLDVCSTARDLFLTLKEHVRDLQSAMRRKGKDSSSVETHVHAYLSFRKKAKKDIMKSIRSLKKMEANARTSEIDDLPYVIKVIREASSMAVSILKCLMMFLSAPEMKTGSGWSLISKLMHSGLLASDKGQKVFSEVGSVDLALCSIQGQLRKADAKKIDVQEVQRRLEMLDASINGFEPKSISLPSRSHPSTVRIEEELSKLRTWEATSTSSSSGSICNGLSGLEDLYSCLGDVLSMGSTQQVLSCAQNEKCVEELLEGSVKLLDVCSTTRDVLLQFKERVQALQSAVRRRKGDSSISSDVSQYASFTKKMRKDAKKMIGALKQMNTKVGTCILQDQDSDHLSAVIRVLREVSVMSSSIFQSLLLFLSAPKSKQSRWSLVSRLMHNGVVACEENLNELESVDAALPELCHLEKMQTTQKKLKALEISIEDFETRLEQLSFEHNVSIER
ncbi:hypothetical protein Tsubulata_041448, partial [Turnera subulata]